MAAPADGGGNVLGLAAPQGGRSKVALLHNWLFTHATTEAKVIKLAIALGAPPLAGEGATPEELAAAKSLLVAVAGANFAGLPPPRRPQRLLSKRP